MSRLLCRTLPFLIGAAFQAACNGPEGTTAAPPPIESPPDTTRPTDNHLEVTPDSITATTLGQAVAVTVTAGGLPTSPTFTVRSERRWLDDHEVLAPGPLTVGRLVPLSPGRAVVEVKAAGQIDSIIVNVAPTRIIVMGAQLPGGRTHLGDGDTIVLRGYRMDRLTSDNLSAPSVALTVGPGDSANVRVAVPTSTAMSCSGAANAFSIAFNDADGSPLVGLTQKRIGEIVLARGEARRLTDADAACLRLTRDGSARYLVAYVDTRLVAKAETQPEFPLPDSILVAGADRSNAAAALIAAARLTSVRESGERLDGVEPAGLVAGCPFSNSSLPFCRDGPYSPSEEFTFFPAGSSRAAAQARVLAIRGNLVASVFLPDLALLPATAPAKVDSALVLMQVRAVPLLQRIFDIAAPTRTSDESGQLLISLEQITGTTAAFSNWLSESGGGSGRLGKVTLGISANSAIGDPATTPTRALLIMSHEVLHTYQFRWRYEHAPPWLTVLGGWGVEAGAQFFSFEMVRADLGIGFTSNYNNPQASLSIYTSRITDFPRSPSAGASLLRDFVQRLIDDGGESYEDALRDVIVGSIEGWYGINEQGLHAGPGMTARMRQRLGPSWNPTDALLEWAMSEAADDQTANPLYQNRTVSRTAANATLQPHAVITNGASFAILRDPGNVGVYRIDDARGGTYAFSGSVRGTPSDALDWLILRIN